MVMRKPGPVLAWFYRAPAALYRGRLGWLMGPHFLMLTTTGRKTGTTRRTVLEVVARGTTPEEARLPTFWVVASRGARTDWYANATAARTARVDWMSRHATVPVHALDEDERLELLAGYQRRHPRLAATLGRAALGDEFTGDPAHLRRLAATLRALRLGRTSEA